MGSKRAWAFLKVKGKKQRQIATWRGKIGSNHLESLTVLMGGLKGTKLFNGTIPVLIFDLRSIFFFFFFECWKVNWRLGVSLNSAKTRPALSVSVT